jgi:uncharacterized protein
MTLDISKLVKGFSTQLNFEYVFKFSDSFSASIGAIDASDFEVIGTVKKIGNRYALDLTYSGDMVFECHRCLNRVTLHFEKSVTRVLATVPEAEEEETILLANDAVDLLPILEEEVTLNLPLQILCSDTCLGLCPTCGKDLNTGMCSCDHTKIDPRLEALKHLLT